LNCGAAMLVKIHVIANSSISKVDEFGEGLKVRVKAKPVGGRANEEVLELLAAHFGVSERCVRIISGHHSKNKTVEIMI